MSGDLYVSLLFYLQSQSETNFDRLSWRHRMLNSTRILPQTQDQYDSYEENENENENNYHYANCNDDIGRYVPNRCSQTR